MDKKHKKVKQTSLDDRYPVAWAPIPKDWNKFTKEEKNKFVAEMINNWEKKTFTD